SGRGVELMERCGDRAQGRSRIIAPLDPNERRRSFYRDDIDRCREIQQAGARESAVNYVPFGSGRNICKTSRFCKYFVLTPIP
ncbi:MAG: hypothetical protein ACI9UA_005613, partial [Pseudoalteromonas tetraodonis]